jgi:hypothetical protein
VASLESLPRSDDADYRSGRDDVDESIVNLVEMGRWLQPPSTNTRIRVIQANTPSFQFYVPPYVVDSAVVDRVLVDSTVIDSAVIDRVSVDSTVVDSALVDGGVVDSDACFSDFHACMISGRRDNCPCFCSLCLLLNSHACWSWWKQKFVGEVQCFRGLAEKHVIMVVEFMEDVVGRMVDEAEKMAATDGMLDEMRAEEAVEEEGADRVVDKQRQPKTGNTKTNKGNGTKKKSTEPKTNKNQEITQARAKFPHTRSKTITNTKDLHRSSSFQNTIECCLRW